MADDEQNLGDEAQTPEETPDPRDGEIARRDGEIARLRKDAQEAKTWARTEAAKRLSTQYGVEITPERLKKIGDLHAFEEVLAQITPKAPDKPAAPDTSAFERLDDIQAVAKPGGTPEELPSARDAADLLTSGKWSPQQHADYLKRKYER